MRLLFLATSALLPCVLAAGSDDAPAALDPGMLQDLMDLGKADAVKLLRPMIAELAHRKRMHSMHVRQQEQVAEEEQARAAQQARSVEIRAAAKAAAEGAAELHAREMSADHVDRCARIRCSRYGCMFCVFLKVHLSVTNL